MKKAALLFVLVFIFQVQSLTLIECDTICEDEYNNAKRADMCRPYDCGAERRACKLACITPVSVTK